MSRKTRHTNADTFFNREKNSLMAYIRSRIELPEDMTEEDLVQDVALQVFSRLNPEEPIRRLASYVYASLRNKIIDLLRKKQLAKTTLNEEYLEVEEANFDSFDPISEGIEIMYIALGSLKDEQQEIIRKTELQGIGFKELSEESGVPVNTLLSRKHRAMKALSEQMRKIIERDDIPWHPGLLSE